jgi:hypothetical protein
MMAELNSMVQQLVAANEALPPDKPIEKVCGWLGFCLVGSQS